MDARDLWPLRERLRLSVEFRVQIRASLVGGLANLRLRRIRLVPAVVPRALDLPAHLDTRATRPDAEPVGAHLVRHFGEDEVVPIVDDRELVAHVTVDGL